MPLEDIFRTEALTDPVRPWQGDGAAAAARMGVNWR
jgi:hypothetical protein